MKKFLAVVAVAVALIGCNKEVQSDFTLSGTVKGLKKGTLYLQRYQDSTFVTLDSMVLNGASNFELHSDLKEPEVLFFRLDKNDNDEGVIPFFADKGITEINTTLKNFNFDAQIKGSKQQELLEEYLKVMNRYNDQNLDIIEAGFEAQQAKDSVAIDSLTLSSERLLKKKYSYTIQFAINHRESEIAPYLAVFEIPGANPVYIDSIYNSLSDTIKDSYYGKQLEEFIANRKNENQ
ncbi:DUF4369 domain-containing protein [Winogradskyella sp. 3972H.M.0a.05]|uniref:DUF4369 domain-containing protein n=1 Tax=Winogradskyella sp. 3972H.M.0a.05 TaxID=2950277 RepID=UPI003397A196